MTTRRQIEANRKNALLSTGPRTPEGKAIVARNPIKHGLMSRETVLPTECQEEFDALQAGLLADLRPEGELEDLLADRVVCGAWRLRRAARVETLLLSYGDFRRPPQGEVQEAEAHDRHLSLRAGNLRKYETTIERSMYRALNELQRVQAAKQGVAVSPPVTIDVSFDGPEIGE